MSGRIFSKSINYGRFILFLGLDEHCAALGIGRILGDFGHVFLIYY